MKWICLALVVLSEPTLAQSTTCQQVGYTTYCNSYPTAPANNTNTMLNALVGTTGQGQAISDREREQALREEQMRLDIQRQRRENEEAMIANMADHFEIAAKMVAAGECNQAISYLQTVRDEAIESSIRKICDARAQARD